LSVSPPVLKVSGAAFGVGAATILARLDFEIASGEWTFVIGPAGSGRTTLLRLVAGELAPAEGTIERGGAARLVLHQAPLDDTKTALYIVAAAMQGPDANSRAKNLLEDLGLEAYLGHEPFRLSRGHRRRLEIACALASNPAVLCLDDPFSPLDQAARRRTAAVLRKATQEQGLAIVMVGNDPLDALRHADRIIVLSPGPAARIVAIHPNAPRPEAAPEELISDPIFEKLELALWDEGA
jgi:ABC-type nitrate/sulfonate/bicarbonate transport system ATPase subunit